MPEHPAVAFLKLLDPAPNATFNIETFTDRPSSQRVQQPDALRTRRADLSAEDVANLIPALQCLNEAGAGVFVAVNQCQGHRSKTAVRRIRGVHADIDGASAEQLRTLRARLPPTIEVQTSGPGNWQFYWLLAPGEAMSTVTAEALNRGLVELGADAAATDISRLLRLPGFLHQKYRNGA